MIRKLAKKVGAILLVGVVIPVVLTACGGSTAATKPVPPAPPASTVTPPPAVTPSPVVTPPPATPVPPPVTPPAPPPAETLNDTLAKGKLVYDKTAGGVGCAYCHGLDGKGGGTSGISAPNIRGAGESRLRSALSGGVPAMSFIKLSEDELKSVVAYMQSLSEQP